MGEGEEEDGEKIEVESIGEAREEEEGGGEGKDEGEEIGAGTRGEGREDDYSEEDEAN